MDIKGSETSVTGLRRLSHYNTDKENTNYIYSEWEGGL